MKYDTDKLNLIDRAKIQLLKHDLVKALRTMKNGDLEIADVINELAICIEWLHSHNAFGTILSAYYKYGICSDYSIPYLLQNMFKAKDYPSFLKQAYRFDASLEFEKEIEFSIKWHEERKLPDASAWRYKFSKLIETNKLQNESDSIKDMVVLDEVEEIAQTVTVPLLTLVPIGCNLTKKKIIDVGKTESDPYIISRTAKYKMEKANQIHKNVVSVLKNFLNEIMLNPIENKLIDTFCEIKAGPAIFEVKSITESNERDQIRHAISQLYEYRFLYGLSNASLWIVFSEKPYSKWCIDYLLNDRKINVIWLQGETFTGPSIDLLH